MIPLGTETPQAIRLLIPWLALGHGTFNSLVMLFFCYQGWLGHVIRRHRLTDAPAPLPVVRRHRRQGPWLVMLGWTGFVAGMVIVLLDKGRVMTYPLHFSLGMTIILTQGGAWAVTDHGANPQRSNNHGTSGHRVPQVAASGTAMRTFVREPDRSPQDVVPCDRLPWAASRMIKGRGPEGRNRHRLLGILLLCLYPIQIIIGLGILL